MGKNLSGYKPLADYVLVRVDIVAKQTSGGIELPEDMVERFELAAQTGVIIASGPGAFIWNADRTRAFEGHKPKAGDHVLFERYAGTPLEGKDGNKYRMMPDRCISGEENFKE